MDYGMLSLLISSILFGFLFMYVRQKFQMYDTKIQSMLDIIQSMAVEMKKHCSNYTEDSESENESDSESSSSSERNSEPIMESKSIDNITNKVITLDENFDMTSIPLSQLGMTLHLVDALSHSMDYADVDVKKIIIHTNEITDFPRVDEIHEVHDIDEIHEVHDIEEIHEVHDIEEIHDITDLSNIEEIVETHIKEIPMETIEAESVKSIPTDIYEGMSVKELKDKVASLGGPPLKTRKALMDFLNSKL